MYMFQFSVSVLFRIKEGGSEVKISSLCVHYTPVYKKSACVCVCRHAQCHLGVKDSVDCVERSEAQDLPTDIH